MQSVTRALRAFVRFREPALAQRSIHLTQVDPPTDRAPIAEPPAERSVEIPLYLEP
ncbi:MAG TPA: hypothetical protein VJ717_06615 [Gemmatimonadaceae bacterium]|nr:hypothetical protein [Gemmatimonadaceae bacterium]